MNEYYDLLMEYTLDSENYKKWREIHGNAFGNVFHSAFDESLEAQIHLTAALIRISSRNFNGGLSILLMLEQFCINDFDNFALSYFTGLCYEFLENEEEMNKYYDKMLEYDFDFEFIIGFHPYYRTAKFAQRKSENTKALNYYNKAFELYCDDETNAVKLQNMGQICYDIGTVYLSCQDYVKSHQFLDMSCKYSPADNPQRNYVLAILFAVEGKRDEAKKIVDSLPDYLKANCQQIVSSI